RKWRENKPCHCNKHESRHRRIPAARLQPSGSNAKPGSHTASSYDNVRAVQLVLRRRTDCDWYPVVPSGRLQIGLCEMTSHTSSLGANAGHHWISPGQRTTSIVTCDKPGRPDKRLLYCSAGRGSWLTIEMTAARCPGPKRHRCKSDTRSLPCSSRRAVFRTSDGSGHTSRRIDPADRISVHDQLKITIVATRPMIGSIQTQPSCRPAIRPMMTNTETAASAIT